MAEHAVSGFKVTYQGYPLDLPIETQLISLRASMGRYEGQTPDDLIGLHIEASSPGFYFEPENATEAEIEDVAEHLSPHVNTQWLDVPTAIFEPKGIDGLDGLSLKYEGDRTPNALTGEDWREPPGLICLYTNEAFRRSEIVVRRVEGNVFEARMTGTTEQGSLFDFTVQAPLSVELRGYRGHSAEELLAWFARVLDPGSFTLETEASGDVVTIRGVLR